jgi:hypothetical protein
VRNFPDRLTDMANLARSRNAEYGGNYQIMGPAMAAMYPDGLRVRTVEEWTRLCLQVMRVLKETRYARNFERGGHEDSMHDLAVYAAMAAETDEASSHRRGSVTPGKSQQEMPPSIRPPSDPGVTIGEVIIITTGLTQRDWKWSLDSHGRGEWVLVDTRTMSQMGESAYAEEATTIKCGHCGVARFAWPGNIPEICPACNFPFDGSIPEPQTTLVAATPEALPEPRQMATVHVDELRASLYADMGGAMVGGKRDDP